MPICNVRLQTNVTCKMSLHFLQKDSSQLQKFDVAFTGLYVRHDATRVEVWMSMLYTQTIAMIKEITFSLE